MEADHPYQSAAVDATLDMIDAGHRQIIEAAPCGAGKTRIIRRLVERFRDMGLPTILYTNRRLLVDNLVREFTDARIPHGVRSGQYEPDLDQLFQISSVQTEDARVLKRGTWKLHDARLVMVDEPHLQTGDVARAILDAHYARGASYVAFDATPVGLAGLYSHLHPICVTSDCRRVGAIVPSHHYGPDEPDWQAFLEARKRANKTTPSDGADLTVEQAVNAMGGQSPQLFGRMSEWFNKLNPKHLPTLCFGADVGSSKWIAQRFSAMGIPFAHMDGEQIWYDGEESPSTDDMRDYIFNLHRKGKIVGLCCRFLLREGLDLPWVRHIIVATIFGSIVTFLQSLGRGGRADRYEDTNKLFGPKTHCVIQDHGGNWWRHGSVNDDYYWKLEDTSVSRFVLRADRIRDGRDPEPVRCPQCSRILVFHTCPCGYKRDTSRPPRPVITTGGKMVLMNGPVFRKHRISELDNGPKIWQSIIFRARNAKKWNPTFRQCVGLFAHENKGWKPDTNWPMMPLTEADMFCKVKGFPMNRLKGYCIDCGWCPCKCSQYAEEPANDLPAEGPPSLFGDNMRSQEGDGQQLLEGTSEESREDYEEPGPCTEVLPLQ